MWRESPKDKFAKHNKCCYFCKENENNKYKLKILKNHDTNKKKFPYVDAPRSRQLACRM